MLVFILNHTEVMVGETAGLLAQNQGSGTNPTSHQSQTSSSFFITRLLKFKSPWGRVGVGWSGVEKVTSFP